MTAQEIAENYINGNLSDAERQLKSGTKLESMGRAFKVYSYIYGEYNRDTATEFAGWIESFSDLTH